MAKLPNSTVFPHGDEPQNYCRNPQINGKYTAGPWCYVEVKSGTKVDIMFNLCNLTLCGNSNLYFVSLTPVLLVLFYFFSFC